MKWLGVSLLPLDGMQCITSSLSAFLSGFPDNSLVPICSWVERGTVRIKYLAQEHNTMTSPEYPFIFWTGPTFELTNENPSCDSSITWQNKTNKKLKSRRSGVQCANHCSYEFFLSFTVDVSGFSVYSQLRLTRERKQTKRDKQWPLETATTWLF